MGSGRSVHWLILLALVSVTIVGVLVVTDRVVAPPPPGATVTLRAYDIETGEPVTGACFSLEGERNGACDADDDGLMTFWRSIPPGTYDVGYERTAHGDHLAVGNFQLIVVDTTDLTVPVAFVQAHDGIPGRAAVTIVPVVADMGTPTTFDEPCFTIHGGSVNGIQQDLSWCGMEPFTTLVRTGTFLLTTNSCADPLAGQQWIAVVEAATVEVPLTATGCISA